MSLFLSNRSTPLSYTSGELPARIHIVPRGELFNQEANVTQVLDDQAIDSILADLRDKSKTGGLYLGESLGQIGIFALFIAVLLFRPQGLFGARA